METMRVVLTDGSEVYEEQNMTEDEIQEANAEANVATGGRLYWTAE